MCIPGTAGLLQGALVLLPALLPLIQRVPAGRRSLQKATNFLPQVKSWHCCCPFSVRVPGGLAAMLHVGCPVLQVPSRAVPIPEATLGAEQVTPCAAGLVLASLLPMPEARQLGVDAAQADTQSADDEAGSPQMQLEDEDALAAR